MYRCLWIILSLSIIACTTPRVAPTMTPVPTATPQPTATPEPYSLAGFEQFLQDVTNAQAEERNWMISSYFASEPTTPIMNETAAIYLYQGSGDRVLIQGDLNNWGQDGDILMERVIGTDLWWYRAEYEPNARLDYVFVVDGTEQTDSRNPLTINTGFGIRSILQMPAYVPLRTWGASVTRGTLTTHEIDSSSLDQKRTFFVYTPATSIIGQPMPSVYVHDGGDYLSLASMQVQLDVLIAEREIPPLVAVFIPPVDRQIEYNTSPAYRAFIAEEVVPFVQANYDVDKSAAQTGTMGASLGGLVSLRLGMEYPDVFNLIGSQSGAFSLSRERTMNMFANQRPLPLRLHLIIGTYETAIRLPAPEGDLLTANRRMVDILDQKGYDYFYAEYPEGHSWGLWSAHVADTLRYLYQREN